MSLSILVKNFALILVVKKTKTEVCHINRSGDQHKEKTMFEGQFSLVSWHPLLCESVLFVCMGRWAPQKLSPAAKP